MLDGKVEQDAIQKAMEQEVDVIDSDDSYEDD